MKKTILFVLVLMMVIGTVAMFAGCSNNTPSASPSPSMTVTPSATVTTAPSDTPSASSTVSPPASVSPSASASGMPDVPEDTASASPSTSI